MSLLPTIAERLSRARADLRMGCAVVVHDSDAGLIMFSAETISQQRLDDLRALGKPPVLTLTSRRAETLKARCYDGDIARVKIPADVNLSWIRALADPADDLMHPMKGPMATERDGDVALHRAGAMPRAVVRRWRQREAVR